MIRAILTDIEGTTSSISFVTETLFPYARKHLRDHLQSNPQGAPAVPVETLEQWIDEDRKEPVLKSLQGCIWRGGYERGELKGHIYPDAAEALRRWRGQGLRLFVYSSGSVEAQKLIFGYSEAGDLTPLFEDWFDLGTGSKLEAASYGRIAEAAGLAPGDMLFLSDNPLEIAAAGESGMVTRLIDRDRGDSFAEIAP